MIVENSSTYTTSRHTTRSLSEDELHSFSSSGFVTMTSIAPADEVAEIRKIMQDLVARRAGENEGSFFDTMESSTSRGVLRSIQINDASLHHRRLLETNYVRNATRIAHQLLSPQCFLLNDFLLLKPANVGAGTPWHQDEAYSDPEYDHAQLTFWMPLQDVGLQDGCMIYLPGSHLMGVLEHRSLNNDPNTHAFECAVSFCDDQSVRCPLPAGGCAVHGQRTLHCSADNVSDVDRYAYLLSFAISPTLSRNPRKAPWLEQRRSPEQLKKRAWMLRGGIFLLLLRKIRKQRSLAPSMYLVYLRKGFKLFKALLWGHASSRSST
jgi:ectoine hydroxylase-related dioxygenase (phytanoyl-CoA dioxygenase family)